MMALSSFHVPAAYYFIFHFSSFILHRKKELPEGSSFLGT